MYTIDKETEMIMMEMMLAQGQFQSCSDLFMMNPLKLSPSQIIGTQRPSGLTLEEVPLDCCIYCLVDDDGSYGEIFEPQSPKPTRRRRAKKPKRTLRDAIKESIRTNGNDQDESKQSKDTLKSETDKKPTTKKIKNQGKGRTFKRKTKKPGRV